MLFTVVIPTFNRASTIKRAISSVLNQSFGEFELIVIDDGSVDETEQIVCAIDDVRIKYKKQKNSGGPAGPRNVAIDIAIGDWICFLDSDDFWYEMKLIEVVKAIDSNPNADIFCHHMNAVDERNCVKKVIYCGPFGDGVYKKLLVWGNMLSTSGVIINRRFLTDNAIRFDERKDFVAIEDYDMWMNIAAKGGCFELINKTLGAYMMQSDSLSLNIDRVFKNHENVLKHHIYKIQNFENNKNKLWNLLHARLLLSRVVLAANSSMWKEVVFTTIRVSVIYPGEIIKVIWNRSMKIWLRFKSNYIKT
jgi:teichuronic acid biosynthesis glycosyltransferase TuaG